MSLEVRLAYPTEAEEIATILRSANGIKVLHEDYVWAERTFTAEEVLESIIKGHRRIGLVDGRPAGTYVLQEEDSYFWGEAGSDQEAVYLHSLGRLKGYKGLGELLVEQAVKEAQNMGRPFMRIDIHRDNSNLRQYYEGLDFKVVDNVIIPATETRPEYPAALMQRTV